MIVSFMHNGPLGGHSGMLATEKRIKQHFYWRKLMKDVRQFVQLCVAYQQQKPENVANASPTPTSPHPHYSMDIYQYGPHREVTHI